MTWFHQEQLLPDKVPPAQTYHEQKLFGYGSN
jgi:hypothetical protein